MAVIVIGGHARSIGKTSVVEGVIAAFPRQAWTAVKITSHIHVQPGTGLFEILEETDRHKTVDTSRFLAAGASRALLLQVRENGMEAALAWLKPHLDAGPVIIEGNSAVRLKPDLYIFVVRPDVEEWKPAARDLAGKADALVIVESGGAWTPLNLPRVEVFRARPPVFVDQDLVRWIEKRVGF